MNKGRITVISALVIALFGCANAQNPEALQNRANADIRNSRSKAYSNESNRNDIQDLERGDEVEEFEEKGESTTERAKRISHAITQLDGIEKASVVVSGNTAIVGIEIVGTLEDAKLIKLKNEVEQKVKNMDTTIEHVAVTAAADLVQRITNMADSVATDENMPTYNSRMQEIIQKLTPPL